MTDLTDRQVAASIDLTHRRGGRRLRLSFVHMTTRSGKVRIAASPYKPVESDLGHLAVNNICLYGSRARAGWPPIGRRTGHDPRRPDHGRGRGASIRTWTHGRQLRSGRLAPSRREHRCMSSEDSVDPRGRRGHTDLRGYGRDRSSSAAAGQGLIRLVD